MGSEMCIRDSDRLWIAKVLDETFALEESKRLELEFQEKERKEAEKRMHRDHEATKVKLLHAHILMRQDAIIS